MLIGGGGRSSEAKALLKTASKILLRRKWKSRTGNLLCVNRMECSGVLSDIDQYVCAAATRSLGHIKAENAAGSLVNVLKDESWLNRLNAREALMQIGKPVVEQLIAAAFSGRLDKVLTQHFIREAIIRN